MPSPGAMSTDRTRKQKTEKQKIKFLPTINNIIVHSIKIMYNPGLGTMINIQLDIYITYTSWPIFNKSAVIVHCSRTISKVPQAEKSLLIIFKLYTFICIWIRFKMQQSSKFRHSIVYIFFSFSLILLIKYLWDKIIQVNKFLKQL